MAQRPLDDHLSIVCGPLFYCILGPASPTRIQTTLLTTNCVSSFKPSQQLTRHTNTPRSDKCSV